ncbi:hypothetical protein EW145_g2838 [Phellinidium pouzarii]|uniref:Centrosomal protein ATPase n=1 Tax=Phellinidium pouzarii TaxID=167371 RepID=A0A4S4L9B9_9AGAM|nr:hypothetical protein EW145_g2838 [Phellinidium pouzarii]
MFTIPYASAQKNRANTALDAHDANMAFHNSAIASSSRLHDDQKKDRKRREIVGRLGREISDKKEVTRQYAESISNLQLTALQLGTRPHAEPSYLLRLYPISLERSALLAQHASEEDYAHEAVRVAYEEERDRVEEEWRKGRDRVRERLLEGIEERRRARGRRRTERASALRNKMGASPPPSSYAGYTAGGIPGYTLPATVVPVPNPNSLSVDELPSPFPLPLTASTPTSGYTGGGVGGGGGGGGGQKRKHKGGGVQPQALTGLGKAIQQLTASKENEVENDLFEIRRSAKRRRAAATTGKP